MTQLRPADRETLPSYLSRLAASKGVATPEFAYDLKGSFNRFLICDPEMIEALSVWARLTPHDTEELLSWTGVRAGNVRLDYRGDSVISRALRNPIVRGCPACLREDAFENVGRLRVQHVRAGTFQPFILSSRVARGPGLAVALE